MPVLEVNDLRKNFGAFQAVKGISFGVNKGEIVGLLGPNGAGKTTTIHMLLGITLWNGGPSAISEKISGRTVRNACSA